MLGAGKAPFFEPGFQELLEHALATGKLSSPLTSPRRRAAGADGLALIDFDRLQMAAPERDISYWGAWTWVTMLTTGQQPRWWVGDELASAYTGFRPAAPKTDPSALGFYRAVALLRIAHGWSALQAAPQTAALVLREALSLLDAE